MLLNWISSLILAYRIAFNPALHSYVKSLLPFVAHVCDVELCPVVWCQFGVEFVAEHLLPMLCPLLIAQQLNVQQFAKYMHFVKEILRFAFTLSQL